MSSPDVARFVNNLSIQADNNQPGHVIASQEAKIGSRTVIIQLHFSENVTVEQAEKQMQLSLEKVASLKLPDPMHAKSTLQLDPKILDSSPEEKINDAALALIPTRFVVESHKALPFPPLTPSLPKISAEKSTKSTDGKVFTDEFTLGSKKVATEKAVRAETVTTLINGLKTKISRLEQKNDPNLKQELDKAKADLERYSRRSEGATWGSTNSPRFAFREMGRRTAKESLAPIVCNLRMQTVENADGIVSAITRSAALSDFSHGEVSLEELKELKSGSKNPDCKIKALVGYGVENLMNKVGAQADLNPILKKLHSADSIMSAYAKLSLEEQLKLLNAPIDMDKLQKVISDRSSRLKLMALQDLQLHLKTIPAKGDPVLYCRTSLLDLQKKSHNEYGLVLDEKTQGLDMKALFDELEGTSLLFDCGEGEEAYIDDTGAIHMPKECAAEGTEKATLTTAFFNICTQGSSDRIQNAGLQQEINDKALRKLESLYGTSSEFTELKNSLDNLSKNTSMDPNDTVVAATLLIQKLGGYTGINCFGGKDRTGYAVALLTHHHVCKLGKKRKDSDAAKEWGLQLLRKNGIAAQIADNNAGHTALKLTRLNPELYDTASLRGKMIRGAHAASGAVMGVKKFIVEAFGNPFISESEAKGQLYKPTMKVKHLSKTSALRKISRVANHLKFGSIL